MSRLEDWIENLRDPRAPLLSVAYDTGAPHAPHAHATDAPTTHSRETDAHRAADQQPVVVMIHGIASSSATFHYLKPLITETHRVIAIDLLGFGGSPRPAHAEYTLDEHVAALAHTIRSLRLEHPFVLVGHSLGTLIASRYAATHEPHIDKLVLVSPPVYLSPNEIGDPRVRQRVSGYLQAYQFFRQNKDFTIAHAAVVSRLLPVEHVMEITEDTWDAFVKSLEHCIESQTVISDLAQVDRPVEVVYGRLDEFLVPGNLAIIEKMRNVTTHVVNVSDHMIRPRMARVVAAAIESPAPGP
ncbi:alpha/beta hydrolase [Herbiconiux sp. KACC 21604]|uniref:alpha/beta fold hydrolase n=1 Tax=unclassified Herbiconiux TaxID=2618217 RepID=UPI0014929A7A|nr:alpha/beta hydrolase [Herbiconiux sp. SALV-R1]QJU54895.1 alpha/beta hydrolase [Herbiconiux sp. SALV-R1]WPO86019.1 alpha/beta hydrolase [Herbiconiux sp. KACC 21604]